VRDEEDRDAERPDDLRHLSAKRFAQERVDVRPRLVEEHELRRGGECTSERNALLLAARELVREPLLEPHEPDDLEQLRHPRRAQTARKSEAHVRGHRQVREERVVLEDHAHASRLGRDPYASGHLAVADDDRPTVGTLEAGDEAEKRRLPATGRAQKSHDLAASDAERRLVDGRDRPEALRHGVEPDHRAIHVRGTLQPFAPKVENPLARTPDRDDP
jgi:hypothetical protein